LLTWVQFFHCAGITALAAPAPVAPAIAPAARNALRRLAANMAQHSHLAAVESIQPSGPGTEDKVLRYRLYTEDGDELGEATYAVWIKPGEMIHVGAGKRLRVLDVVPVEEEDSPFVGLLTVEPI
jgi:hypothetical protein